jgi:hypothetical protein
VANNDLYSTPEKRLDTILGDAGFWRRMQKCRMSEEGKKHCTSDIDTRAWFFHTHGIMLLPSDSIHVSGYSRNVEIVDEKKYLVFLLKYT